MTESGSTGQAEISAHPAENGPNPAENGPNPTENSPNPAEFFLRQLPEVNILSPKWDRHTKREAGAHRAPGTPGNFCFPAPGPV